jgi:LL-diaminopimelate aminotransferase
VGVFLITVKAAKLMKTKNVKADRLLNLPPYFFSEFDRKRDAVKAKGVDLIDMSIGDPDILPSAQLKRAFIKALDNPKMHRYPPYKGTHSFCNAISSWYASKGIKINPQNEVWSLIGSKEGLVHLIIAMVNPGEVVLLQNPFRATVRL